MADEFQLGSGNWWDAPRNRYDTESTAPSSSALHGCTDQSGGHPNLHMMELGLSSQAMDWNEALLGEKGESSSSFRSILQEDLSNFQQDSETVASASSHEQWAHNSAAQDFRQMNCGFSLDQPHQFSSQACSNDSTITSHSLTTRFPLDSAAPAYSLLLPENHQQLNFPCPSSNTTGLIPSWNNKFPPPKEPIRHPPPLHFSNNTPFWNASASAADARPSFFTGIETHILGTAPSFTEKPKNALESGDSSTSTKKSSTETSSSNYNKRARNETPSSLPAFKVRKEKMGDRITALQQLVSPFGKTDTASVLSEAIEYIKVLHEQISVLSTPYMKNGFPVQHQQNPDHSKHPTEGPRQDLRSRGLCLVPVSSTFPVTHETTVDFWTPTFGGSFR